MTNEENTVKSSDVAPKKKAPVKKAPVKKAPNLNAVDGDKDGILEDGTEWERPAEPAVVVEKNNSLEPIVIYLQSGFSYTTPSGLRFDQEHLTHELPFLEANLLLRLENFRMANDEEKNMYYNNTEG